MSAPTPSLPCDVCGTPTHLKCSRCHTTHYCSRDCQKGDWKSHKLICEAPSGDAAGGAGSASGEAVIAPADASAVEKAGGLQAILDAAPEGATVKLPVGSFGGAAIRKPLTVKGAAGRKTVLTGLLELNGGAAAKPLRVEGLTCLLGVNVAAGARVELVKLKVTNPGRMGIMTGEGAALSVTKTEIHECEDGIINNARLVVDGCFIHDCGCDGIFSNPCFTIKDSTIADVGRHGIKSRGGTERLGRNNVQASPWDASPW